MGMTESERYVREFAETFPTVNVLTALTMCETGVLKWDAVAKVFDASLLDALNTAAQLTI